jgi:hypothetical protein
MKLDMTIGAQNLALFHLGQDIVQRITQPDSLTDIEAFGLRISVVEL